MADGSKDLGDGALVLVSNRGPVQHAKDDGVRTAKPGHGGLVTALAGLGAHLDDAVWVYGSPAIYDYGQFYLHTSDEDPELAVDLLDDLFRVR